MMTKNVLAMCSVIALIIALLFILSAIIILISIIVSKVNKNDVKPVRIIITLVCIACGILSCAGYSSLHSQLIESVYGEHDYFDSIYDSKEGTITINNITYVKTPVELYDNIYENDDLMIGEYYVTYDEYLGYDEEYSDVERTIGGMIGLAFGQGLQSEDYYQVYLYRYDDGEYSIIYSTFDGIVYCSEAQYDDYLNYYIDNSAINWNAYLYSDESTSFDKVGDLTDITDNERSMFIELADASNYSSDEPGLVEIADENLVSVNINIEKNEYDSFIYYILYYNNGSFYSHVDYRWDEYDDDKSYYICYKLSDASCAALKDMVELPDED